MNADQISRVFVPIVLIPRCYTAILPIAVFRRSIWQRQVAPGDRSRGPSLSLDADVEFPLRLHGGMLPHTRGDGIAVSAADCARLERVVKYRNSPQKHVWWTRIILASGDDCGTAEIIPGWACPSPASGDGSGASWPPAPPACCVTRPGSPAWRRRRPPSSTAWSHSPWMTRPGDHALYRPGDGSDRRHLPTVGAADLGRARARAASGALPQAVHAWRHTQMRLI